MKANTLDPFWVKNTRIVATFILLSWYANVLSFLEQFRWQLSFPILSWSGVPGWAVNPVFCQCLYWLPLLTIPLLCTYQSWAFCTAAVLLGFSFFGACVHLLSHADATFTCCFWSSVWLLVWCYTSRHDRVAYVWAARMALVIVSFCFLGGFIGKWTEDYWSGQAFYTMNYAKSQRLHIQWVREHLSPELFRTLVTYVSRMAIITEGALAICFLLPIRMAVILGLIMIGGMIVCCDPQIFCAVGPFVGLLIVAWRLDAEVRHAVQAQPSQA